MRKLATLLFCLVVITATKAQYVNIADANFRNFLISKYPGCFNTAKQLDTTCTAITTELVLACSHSNFVSIDGVQYFDNLKILDCSSNSITALPRLPKTLTSLTCDYNNISSISNLPVGLKRLLCQYQNTTLLNVPALPSSLTCFMATLSKLGNLPALPNSLDTLGISGCFLRTLSSLPVNLKYLDCYNNILTALPSFPSSLQYINCGHNYAIASLPALPSTLTDLYIEGLINISPSSLSLPSTLTNFGCNYCYWNSLPALPNGLTYLDMSSNNFPVFPTNLPNSIQYLYANNSNISTLTSLPSSLFSIYINDNSLTSLPTLPNNLTTLNIDRNQIKSLPTLPSVIQSISWQGNQLDSVKPFVASGSLKTLYLDNNNLKALPTLPSGLTFLSIKANSFDSFPKLPSLLTTLDISYNYNLDFIPSLPSKLKTLKCTYDFNLSCLPKLPSTLTRLHIDSTNIQCIANKPIGLKFYDGYGGLLTNQNFPVCNPTNNANHCVSFPTITGKAFHDINKNGVQDIGEAPKAFGLIMLSNGSFTFTDMSGIYTIQTDTLGVFSVTLLGSSFYNNVPSIQTCTVNKYDTIVNMPNIALQPNTVVDSMQVFATPLYCKARPGFGFPYFVGYANVGTTNLTPTVKLGYPNNYLVYDSCSNPLAVNTGSSLNETFPVFPAGGTGYEIGYFRLKPTATLGDTIKANVSATSPTTNVAYDAPYTIITGSFDPNDKDATPSLTTTQVALGKEINYTIRFQNTGNDTAFTVVIADTLSNLLQTKTLKIIQASHNCKTTVKGNVVTFEFLNIKLPDSNINYYKSHGFVRFTIKPKTTLIAGTSIYNKAYIYFDYNSAIITNTAITLIKSPVVTPVKFAMYDVRLAMDKHVKNSWTTATEINVSHFNVQRSVNGKDFVTIGKVRATGAGNYDFFDNHLPTATEEVLYYKLQVIDKDGTISYSDVKLIKLNVQAVSIAVYPNPAKGFVKVECANAKEILIIDFLGKVAFTKSISQQSVNTESYLLNIQSLQRGMYMLRVILTTGAIKNEKLLVE